MILITKEMDCPDFAECYGFRHEEHSGHRKILYACDNFEQVRNFLDELSLENKVHGDLEWEIWHSGDKEPFRTSRIQKEEIKTYKYTLKEEGPELRHDGFDRNSHKPWEDQ